MIGKAILVTNGEGEDDDEEWFLPNFGRDEEYYSALNIYLQLREHNSYPYSGGWAEQLAIHHEIIELFKALDYSIPVPEK